MRARNTNPALGHLNELYFHLETTTRLAALRIHGGLTALSPIYAVLERQTGNVLALIEEEKATERRS